VLTHFWHRGSLVHANRLRKGTRSCQASRQDAAVAIFSLRTKEPLSIAPTFENLSSLPAGSDKHLLLHHGPQNCLPTTFGTVVHLYTQIVLARGLANLRQALGTTRKVALPDTLSHLQTLR
jgi:hypothetical protein